MSQTINIKLILALMSFLLRFQVKAYSPFNGLSLRNTILNAHATSSGVVELIRDSSDFGLFYVEADLSYDAFSPPNRSSDASKVPQAPKTANMMLSICNEETMVSKNCFHFDVYDCKQYNCTQFDRAKTIDYPSFTTDAIVAKADLYLDYNYWSFEDTTDYLYLAQACQSDDENTGKDRSGVIGLGVGTSSKYNYRSSKMFSFNIEPDLSKGQLIFKNDTSTYAESSEPLFEMYSPSSTWKVNIIDSFLKIGNETLDLSQVVTNVAFDINSDAIALPYQQYESLLSSLGTSFGIKCVFGYYRPRCVWDKKIEDLPNITLKVNGNEFNIPPKIYATATKDSAASELAFYLNFRGTGADLFGKSYVTPTFQNSILLDANFLSYYYTVFDFSSKSGNYISFYKAKHSDPKPNPNPDRWVWIVILVAVLVVAIGLVYYFSAKKRQTVQNKTTGDPWSAPLMN